MRRVYLLSAITLVLCLSGIGVAAAEPQKNQIEVVASCKPDGQEFTFVINGMSKTGDVQASTSNVVVKQYTVQYIDENGTPNDPLDDVVVRSDRFEFGNKKALDPENGDLLECSGVAEDIDVQGLGTVTAVYDSKAFVTPREGA